MASNSEGTELQLERASTATKETNDAISSDGTNEMVLDGNRRMILEVPISDARSVGCADVSLSHKGSKEQL